MKVIEKGHIYELNQIAAGLEQKLEPDEEPVILKFVNRESNPHPGTQTQEVIRALIDRTQHCQACLDCKEDDEIIYHLRMALLLHETRAMKRKLEKGILSPELVEVANDGHFQLTPKA